VSPTVDKEGDRVQETEKTPARKSYQAPVLVEVGSFRKNTGYIGLKTRESLINYPRELW
jgi:hypothetical protein